MKAEAVVAQFSQSTEAHIAKNYLESQGITCWLQDEHIVNMNWLYSNLVGGVKLVVDSEHEQKAKKLLEEIQLSSDKNPSPTAGASCPQCHSDKTVHARDHRRGWILLVLYFTALPLFFLSGEKWHCQNCGHQWRSRERTPWMYYLFPVIVVAAIYFLIRLFGVDSPLWK